MRYILLLLCLAQLGCGKVKVCGVVVDKAARPSGRSTAYYVQLHSDSLRKDFIVQVSEYGYSALSKGDSYCPKVSRSKLD